MVRLSRTSPRNGSHEPSISAASPRRRWSPRPSREHGRLGHRPRGTAPDPRRGGRGRDRRRLGGDGGGDHRRSCRARDGPGRRLALPRRHVDGRMRRYLLRLLLPGEERRSRPPRRWLRRRGDGPSRRPRALLWAGAVQDDGRGAVRPMGSEDPLRHDGPGRDAASGLPARALRPRHHARRRDRGGDRRDAWRRGRAPRLPFHRREWRRRPRHRRGRADSTRR